MPSSIYDIDVWVECKRLFVQRSKAPEEISELMGGRPAPSTIYNWANSTDTEGRTWWQLREEERDRRYQEASPQSIAARLIEEIHRLLADDGSDAIKRADAIAKLQKSLERIMDTSYQIPVMYSMLEDLVLFMRDHHADLLSAELLGVFRRFKNLLRERLEG